MKSVKEVSQLSGVSVRTLHYYDEIDLLKPSVVAENGYRYYNRDAVVRLQEILLYRELDFPLKKIKEIVGQPGYDKVQALRDQIKLLELKKSRLEAVIAHAKALQMEEEEMSFEAFDQKAVKVFQEEAQARWGQTEAYQAFAAKGEESFHPHVPFALDQECESVREIQPRGQQGMQLGIEDFAPGIGNFTLRSHNLPLFRPIQCGTTAPVPARGTRP